MPRFVRWILLIVLLFTLAMLSLNVTTLARNRKHRAEEINRETNALKTYFAGINDRTRRIDVVMASHEIDARQNVISTTLLVREAAAQSIDTPPEQVRYLSILTIKINGDRPHIEGDTLTFPEHYDANDMLSGKTLAFFRGISSIPKNPDDKPEDMTVLTPNSGIPAAYQVDPSGTQIEREIWGRVWFLLENPQAFPGDLPQVHQFAKDWPAPIEPQKIYQVYLSAGGLEIVTKTDFQAWREIIDSQPPTPSNGPENH